MADDAIALVYREAELLDEWRLAEWLELWSDEALYWIPAGHAPELVDPQRQVSIAYDDRQRLEERVARLESGLAHAQDPRSRVVRLLSNVRVRSVDESSAELRCNVALFESRLGREQTLAGVVDHLLVRNEGGWRIRSKKVSLVQSGNFVRNLAYII
jgi:3-phenylpropionate/cinnamic acid dioxygenase small subunit